MKISFKDLFFKNIGSFEYLEYLFHYILSLILLLNCIFIFEMVIFIFYDKLYIKIMLFYFPILSILSILTLISFAFLIYVFSNFYKMEG